MRGGSTAAAIRAHPVIAECCPSLRRLFERIVEVIGSDENDPEGWAER